MFGNGGVCSVSLRVIGGIARGWKEHITRTGVRDGEILLHWEAHLIRVAGAGGDGAASAQTTSGGSLASPESQIVNQEQRVRSTPVQQGYLKPSRLRRCPS